LRVSRVRASTGFHSGVRRAGSPVTRYVPFKEGITKFDTEFAVFGHKTASDTKSGAVSIMARISTRRL
jgi:hypothetical protein